MSIINGCAVFMYIYHMLIAILLIDRGYFKIAYFQQLIKNEAAFIINGKSSMNPTVTRAITAQGKAINAWRDKPLKELKGK